MYSQAEQQHLLATSQDLLKESGSPGDEKEAKKLADKLRQVINYHDWRYYVQSDPVISDYDYDQMFKQLKELEDKFPSLATPDSPTQRVAFGLTKDFPQVEHLVPMLSLDNSYNEEDLVEWDKKLKKLTETENLKYCVEPKFDGASIALVYENDLLSRGATRGDGAVGEEVTNNIKVLKSIPLSAKFSDHKINKIELRGEILINKEKFKHINEKRMEEGLPVLANPRNTASGALRMQDAKEVASRGLEGFIYHIAFAEDRQGNNLLDKPITNHAEAIKLLYDLGFRSPEKEIKVCKNIQEVVAYCELWQEKRDTYPYEIDGMVVKVNEFSLQKLAGSTSHHPRWAMAFKFKARQATTKLNDVKFNVGRTGVITPLANVEPVFIAGVTISNVSLFNEDVVREKGLMIGDTVLVERAGDVIPYIVKPVVEARKGNEREIVFPERCPSCNSALVRPEGEVALRCVNIECPAQAVERIIHFVSKGAMDVRGFGASQVIKFFNLGFIKTIPDIYTLDFDEILKLEGYKTKSVENLKSAIEASKSQPLYRLIFGLGIRFIGQATAKILAKNVNKELEEIADWDMEKLQELEDIGPKVAESIIEFFGNERNRKLIRRLKELGVNTQKTATEEPKSHKLEGLSFLFTGTLEKFTREDAQELVEENGGKNVSSVSSKLNYLVVGSSPGSKVDKAKKIGTVKILSEDEFLEMVG